MNDTEILFYRYLYAKNEFIKVNMDRKQRFEVFKSVFEDNKNQVSDSELYRLIQEKGIEYGTFKSRDFDIRYVSSELKPIMEKTGIVFEDKWGEKNRGNKSFKCTISNELWKTLTAPSPETESSVDEEKFGKYLKELFSRYEYIFKYEVPEFFAQNSESDNHTQKSERVGSRYIK